MTEFRSEIDKFLNELKFDEGGMKFQDLAVVLAKQKWPELIACERKNDLGLDAHAPAEPLAGRVGKGLAASITPTLGKIFSDADKVAKITKNNFSDITMLIFVTSQKVSNPKKEEWATKIKKKYGYDLVVMSRQDIITSLVLPSNASLCRSFGIPALTTMDVADLVKKMLEATSALVADRLSEDSLKGKPLLPLRAIKLDYEGKETSEILQLHDIKTMLLRSHRIVLEAPAGRGKTTTLVQLADQYAKDGSIALLVDLPAWMMSEKDILEFIAGLPHLRSRQIDAQTLAKIYDAEHITFLLNGWNEISDNYSEKALINLKQLERNFPASGIIVATRTHHLTPPLPGALRAKLLSINRAERAKYLQDFLENRGDELCAKLDGDVVLDQLTRTPLILSKVVDIFSAGLPIPATKMGVLDAVMDLIEQSFEHSNQLQLQPLNGHARTYLSELAMQMMSRDEVLISEKEARPILGSVSLSLRDIGQISIKPDSQTIINALCSHHILERQDYPSATLRFEHQQFQEFFIASQLKNELLALIQSKNDETIRKFTKKYVNEPIWSEPLQMLAEEIGVQASEKKDLIEVGVLLVKMALNVDPIFASGLARLCGEKIWKNAGTFVSDCLRSWYRSNDPNHRKFALIGMIETGATDFNDIVIPLLTSKDQHVRLDVYHSLDGFHLSTLGPDWKDVVKKWDDQARSDFVCELLHQKWIPEVAEYFIFNDPRIMVRKCALQAASWSGSQNNLATLFENVDEKSFCKAIPDINVYVLAQSARGRALEVFRKLYDESSDSVQRLRYLIKCDLLREKVEATLLKNELEKLDPAKFKNLEELVIKPALEIIKRTDGQWVSEWVAEHIADASLYHSHWSGYIITVPQAIMNRWFLKFSSEDLRHEQLLSINQLLAIGADQEFAEKVFIKLCDLKRTIASNLGGSCKNGGAIIRQIENLFRELAPKVAISGFSKCFVSDFDSVEFRVIIDLLNSVGRQEPDLHDELDDDQLRKLHDYLKSGLSYVMTESDYDGSLKAEFASSLARIGNSEDMTILHQLIQADIIRLRDRTPLSGGRMSYSNWYLQALIQLDLGRADNIILELLQEPEYEQDCARSLVCLAMKEQRLPGLFDSQKDYSAVWKAREGGQSIDKFDEARRTKYAQAIREEISKVLDEFNTNGEVRSYNLKKLAEQLSVLDPKNSANLVIEVMLLSDQLDDDWSRVSALENLLFGGAKLPSAAVFKMYDSALDRNKFDRYHGGGNAGLLKRFLCLLVFTDNAFEGIKKIKEAILKFRLPTYEQRDIITAVGHSRCPDSVTFLYELAGSNGEHIQEIGEVWFSSLAVCNTVESKKLLMSFVNPQIDEFETITKTNHGNLTAMYIANIARNDPEIYQKIIQLCDLVLSVEKRELLSRVITLLNSEEMIIASFNLIDDSVSPSIPHSLVQKLKTTFIEHRPYGESSSTFSLVPRSANLIRKTLFKMAVSDGRRKQAARALLGKIEIWRLDYGKPPAESRHPDYESGYAWPLL